MNLEQIAIVVGIIYAVVLVFLPFKLWGAADQVRKQRKCQERQEKLLTYIARNLEWQAKAMEFTSPELRSGGMNLPESEEYGE